MPIEINSPQELVWNEGDLPDVHSVPYNCVMLAWIIHDFDLSDRDYIERFCKMNHIDEERIKKYNGKFKDIKVVSPWKNEFNPDLRWYDGQWSIGYVDEKVIFWAWISKGEK